MNIVESKLDINKIIIDKAVITLFQPIISINQKSVIGIEALSRGLCHDGSLVPPKILFDLAGYNKKTIDLDRLCREKALKNFKYLYNLFPNILLFMNFDASVIDLGVAGSGYLFSQVRNLNLSPNNIVIEIIESKVNDTKALSKFINVYRNYGFLIALDDIGCGYSNLDRISVTGPDFLKVDHSLISGLESSYYKQEVLKSIVNLAKKIGSLVIAEGIEREEEAVVSLELGVNMLQGFYFSKPTSVNCNINKINKRINLISNMFREHMVDKIYSAKRKFQRCQMITDDIIRRLSMSCVADCDILLEEIIINNSNLECIYLLDERGVQISDTFCKSQGIPGHRSSIFKPAPRGTDHSLKEYYYLLLNTGLERYTTEPYISLASGKLCITISSLFNCLVDGQRYIICIDVNL